LTAIPNIGVITNKMSKNTSVTLGEHFEQIIKKSIESGRYFSASEVIRAGLRLVYEREQKINILS
jgi:antitoxin ParD1/3/4